jgi:hypothetical protein
LVAAIQRDTEGETKALSRLQLAIAFSKLAVALGPRAGKGESQARMHLEKVSASASRLVETGSVNACEVWSGLAEAWFLAGENGKAQQAFERGVKAWRLWSPGSEERIQHLERLAGLAARSTELAEGFDWVGTAQGEAERAFDDWKWQGWLAAARIAIDHKTVDKAEALLARAVSESRKNPNVEVRLACAVEVALAASRAGFALNPELIQRLGLTDEAFTEWEGGTSRD